MANSGSLSLFRSFASLGGARLRCRCLRRDRALRLLDRSGIAVVRVGQNGGSQASSSQASDDGGPGRDDARPDAGAIRQNRRGACRFDQAIAIDPNNAQALYGRGLLYQGEKQHQLAIDDFTAANGLRPQQAEPLLGRAISYLALNKIKEAAADLDEAAQADPQNGQIWTTRGLAYERLGDKAKAAESYSRAINLHPKDETARTGFARVGGRSG